MKSYKTSIIALALMSAVAGQARAADEAQVAVGQQVLCVTRRIRLVLAAKDPADVRVTQPPQRAPPAWRLVDVGTVRIARDI